MHYKAPDNSLHFVEPEFAHLLPAGSVPISEEEAEVIRAASIPVPTPLDLLNKLDAENTLTQRNLRDFILLTAEAVKQATGGALDMSQIPGVAMVKAVEEQAEVLRSQL